MPGIVTMAANDEGVIYEGAFGKRDLSARQEMARRGCAVVERACTRPEPTRAPSSPARLEMLD